MLNTLLESNELKSSNADLYIKKLEKYSALLHIGDNQYYPDLYVPNCNDADWSLNPIIAIGEPIFSNEVEPDDDQIAGWYLDNQEHENVVTLYEEDALSSNRPVIIITNHDDPEISIENPPNSNLKSESAVLWVPDVTIDIYSIDRKYEGSGASDYNIRVGYLWETLAYQEGPRDEIRNNKRY